MVMLIKNKSLLERFEKHKGGGGEVTKIKTHYIRYTVVSSKPSCTFEQNFMKASLPWILQKLELRCVTTITH
jgi:hypothetical protein